MALQVFTFGALPASAATPGTIAGTINVNGASVTATDTVTGFSYITQSAGGSYTVANLQPGNYYLNAVAPGYDFIQSNPTSYTVTSGGTTTVSISMVASVTPGITSEIDVQRPAATSIADGGTDNIGSQTVGLVSLTYTIDNTTGTNTLTLGTPTATNFTNVSGFSVTTPPPSSISAGNTGTFVIQFTVNAPGMFSFDIDIGNSDSNENPYDIAVSGVGVGVSTHVGGEVYPPNKLLILAPWLGHFFDISLHDGCLDAGDIVFF